MDLIRSIEQYAPFNAQEIADKALILRALTQPGVFSRENLLAHATASAWIVNARRDRVLMAYHNIYKSWSWLGGHADGEQDLLSVALREAGEESGLKSVRTVSEDIFSLEALTVDGHEKRGKYVPSHIHLNLTYLVEADDLEPLTAKADENSDVRWFSLDEAVAASTEPWMRDRIYGKLNQKLREGR
ncbi:MAG: NUDIX hydrolase [Clostridiales bacterium]|nr:NUDIX hydrolase [Clostridiales bacterium]